MPQRATPLTTRSIRLLRRNNPFRVLVEQRNFRIFWTGQTVSLVGTWMQSMASGWLALELTDNAFLVTLVAAVGSLPILLLSLHAGVYADRADRLKVVRIAQTLMLVEAAALWWLTWSGQITYPLLLALAAAHGVFNAIEIPARQAMTIDLVGREGLREAIALNSSGFNLARIVGPALGALVIGTLGIAWCFFANAVSYLAVLGGLALIRLPRWEPRASAQSPLEGILEGLRYIRHTREVFALMQLVLVFSIFGVPYLSLMPVVARDQLGLGADGYGLLLTSVGVGGLTGALALAALAQRVRRGRLLVTSGLTFGALLVLFAFVRAPLLASAVLLVTGLTMILNNALINALLQHLVPDALRGRLMAVYSLIVVGISQVVGAFVAGAVARAIGPDWAIGGGAAVMLGFTLWAMWRYPELKGM